ncbi:hypothetical protein [Fischerella sp. JS2]|uniref:hypothetical protein n=1 Tax=Fischerella sp. JS2 TaxID=2597771 RepID=UPI0028E5BBF1|nr:hypothetical protein [Fischerella sp. JS2]
MNLLAKELPSPKTIQEAPVSGKNQETLIAHGLQKEQYIGISGLAIALIAAVGFFSRRFEYALVFALILSAILIALFLVI